MTDLIYDYITMGIDMIVSASILAVIVILLRGASILSNQNAMQQANADKIDYYREYSMYDNTTNLSAAEVKSALAYYKNDLVIVIQHGGSTAYKSTPNGTPQGSVNAIGANYKYKAQIFEDNKSTPSEYYSGGIITGILFIKQ